MTDARTVSAKAPTLNPLQRAWLREIGMEKVWLRQDEPPPAVGRAHADAPPTSPGTAAGPSQAHVRTASGETEPAGGAATSAASALAASGANLAPSSGRQQPGGRQEPSANPQAGADTAPAAGAPTRPPVVVPRPAKSPVASAHPAKDTLPPQPAPTAESLAMLDMAALRERVIECTACGLCRGRRQAVFGMGAEQARWMVVGEAPGEQEDRQGLPFVGRSGQLLDSMLAAVGLSRERDVYIANVIKCRPPGNRNPKPEEIAACRPYLMRQIALLKPERILVLGRFAAQTLLETDAAIGSLRGRVHTLKTADGEIPMVVSYHPAYLLRSPAEKARAWQDLRLAVGLVRS